MVPLDRMVLVIDETTDRALLERMLQGMWQTLSPTSPNRVSDTGGRAASLRILSIAKQSRRRVKQLLLLLFASNGAAADSLLTERNSSQM